MCGRYASVLPSSEIAALFRTTGAAPNTEPNWNLAPTQLAPVVRRNAKTGERHLDLLSWGLLPHFTKDRKAAIRPINARADTVQTGRMFHFAFEARRCLVPADAYYEWQTTHSGKDPFAIARTDGTPLAFAGLWESWRSPDLETIRSFTIITTSANATLAPMHPRMPVVLEPQDWPLWLGETAGDPAPLMRPAAKAALRAWPVSRAVNNVRNNGAALLEEVEQRKESLLF